MENKDNLITKVLTIEEINELLKTVDETDDEEEVEEDAEYKKKVEEIRKERRVLLNLFGEATEALKAWFGRELKYAKLHSLDIMSYADFVMSCIDLSEYYIAINDENINTNIILSIDESILIGLNGDPTLDEKTEVSDINELRIVEAIASFVKENKIASNTTVVKEDRNSEMKQFPEDKEGIVLLYELIPNACTRSGIVMMFVPRELVKLDITD